MSQRRPKTPRPGVRAKGLDTDARPRESSMAIFEDLTNRALEEEFGFEDAINTHYKGRSIKVATMCSGTESPIFALGLIRDVLRSKRLRFEFDHLFSAEIVPYKQAFIERNFSPPIIFRDITELNENGPARTAYGASRNLPDPGEVHVLIAGFACVDFSNLNTKRQTQIQLEASEGPRGESSSTFFAIYDYVKKYRPGIIIIENIVHAPWKQLEAKWKDIGYNSAHITVDTKNYYIPQTRERGYMICIDHQSGLNYLDKEDAERCSNEWVRLMKVLQCRASSSVDGFLLNENHPLLRKAKQGLVNNITGDISKKESDWSVCQERHRSFRNELNLGIGTPYTQWRSGRSRMPEYANFDWGCKQADRVKDTLDILKLSFAKDGEDFEYKSMFPDLSQNVDRLSGVDATGIIGCITPCGMPFSSIRGGPVTGLEALLLQGLPLDRLHLSRETNRDLQDLAGNAMTATVVGAAILAALTAAKEAIPEALLGDAVSTFLPPAIVTQLPEAPEHLQPRKVNFGPVTRMNVAQLQSMASRSVQMCACEGQSSITTAIIFKCRGCHKTVCKNCAGIPPHCLVQLEGHETNRISPQAFLKVLSKALPTMLCVNLTSDMFKEAGLSCDKFPSDEMGKQWEEFLDEIFIAFRECLILKSTTRLSFWEVIYESSRLTLKLGIRPYRIAWSLFAKPKSDLRANHPMREVLAHPIAQIILDPSATDLLHGQWWLRVPTVRTAVAKITGSGESLPSWRSALGIKGFEAEKVWDSLSVEFEEFPDNEPFQRIAGHYGLLPECGTANRLLHVKKEDTGKTPPSDPVFMFLDATRFGKSSADKMVLSNDIRRLRTGERRNLVASFSSYGCPENGMREEWRPKYEKQESVICAISGRWNLCVANLAVPQSYFSSFYLPRRSLTDIEKLKSDEDVVDCSGAGLRILQCKFPWTQLDPDKTCRGGKWEINERNEHHMVIDLYWLSMRLPELTQNRSKWIRYQLNEMRGSCKICAPPRPRIKWRQEDHGRSGKAAAMLPFEDAGEAGPYETNVKKRPSPISIMVIVDRSENIPWGSVAIDINVRALIHRAVSSLPRRSSHRDVEVFWRLETQYIDTADIRLPRFKLCDNGSDDPLPFRFEGTKGKGEDRGHLELRTEQERSLRWMVEQDAANALMFPEQVVEECFSTILGWRLEACAYRPTIVRGGILADKVGFGKTVTIIALIRATIEDACDEVGLEQDPAGSNSGPIPLKATCIFVPEILLPQWKSEILKFWPDCKLICISMASIKKLTVKDFRNAEVVLTSVKIVNMPAYMERQASLAGLPEPPELKTCREQGSWLGSAIPRILKHSSQLQETDTPSAFGKTLSKAINDFKGDETNENTVPSKRLKGAAFLRHQASKREVKPAKSPKVQLTMKSDTSQPSEISGFAGAKSYQDMKFPVLSMFRFHRKVIDEQTYMHELDIQAVSAIKSHSTWVLSGTPRISDFQDIKRMANLLGFWLGVDDDTPGIVTDSNIKTLLKDKTDVERFETYKVTRTSSWHEHRHRLAQDFLNRFARQNTIHAFQIPSVEKIKEVQLDANHCIRHAELQALLLSENAKRRRDSVLVIERSRQLQYLLGNSSSMQERLLVIATTDPAHMGKCAATRDPSSSNGLLTIREQEIDSITSKLRDIIKHIRERLDDDIAVDAQKIFANFAMAVENREHGDDETASKLQEILLSPIQTKAKVAIIEEASARKAAEIDKKTKKPKRKNTGSKPAHREEKLEQKEEQEMGMMEINEVEVKHEMVKSNGEDNFPPLDNNKKEAIKHADEQDTKDSALANKNVDIVDPTKLLQPQMRTDIAEAHTQAQFLTNAIRSRRFMLAARKLQKAVFSRSLFNLDCNCSTANPAGVILNADCGHASCIRCFDAWQKGHHCRVQGCNAQVVATNVITCSDLACMQEKDRPWESKGQKIEKIIDLINKSGKYEQVLVFSQFELLTNEICLAFDSQRSNWQYYSVKDVGDGKAGARAAQDDMQAFRTSLPKEKGWRKVMVLNHADSSSAGHNLTNASIIIFVSPLLAEDQETFGAAYTQAIGRAKRFGQKKEVKIYHFLSLNTIDVNIWLQRKGGTPELESRASRAILGSELLQE